MASDQHPSASRIRTFPDLIRREAVAAFVALALLTLISACWDAPLSGPAHELPASREIVKAPWIFVGIQQLLRFFPPLVGGVAIPSLVLLCVILVPFVSRESVALARWLFGAAAAVVSSLTLWGLLS